MKPYLFLPVLLLLSAPSIAQGKYKLLKSNIKFFSDAPMEDITAFNVDNQGLVDFDAKTYFIKVPIKSFKFDSDLMKDHFNENYMESEKFPFATFKGNWEGQVDLKKDGEYPLNATGDLTIHGVPQKRTVPVMIVVKGGVPTLKSKFNVKLADHKIDIPTLVFEKLAEVVEVTTEADLGKL